MKKIGIVLVLTLFLVGCGNGKEELPSKQGSKYQLQFDEMKIMNCYREFYVDENGIKYYTEIGSPINIQFSDNTSMPLTEALDKKMITMEEIIADAGAEFARCKVDDLLIPCDGDTNHNC